MDKQLWILLLFAFTAVYGQGRKFLSFIAHEEVTSRKLSYEMNFYNIKIDAYFQMPVVIKFNHDLHSTGFAQLKFFCAVDTLDPKYSINTALLCRKQNLLVKEDCHQIKSEKSQVQFNDFMSFDVNYDDKKGFEATFSASNDKVQTEPFDGLYYCRLKNILGSIESNYFEIQDFEYYQYKVSKSINPISKKLQAHYIEDINSLSYPVNLHCGKSTGDPTNQFPRWIPDNMLSPFSWYMCPDIDSPSKCFAIMISSGHSSALKSLPVEEYFDTYYSYNGTLTLLGSKNTAVKHVTFGCAYNSNPYQSYAIYMGKTPEKRWRPVKVDPPNGQFNSPIKVLSPIQQSTSIREGSYDTFRFKLTVSYVANPDHTKRTFEWKKDGYNLPAEFEMNSFQLIFPKEINRKYSGLYTLEVTQFQPQNSVKFQFDVKVEGVPKLLNADLLPSTLYLLDDQPVSLNVTFDRSLTKKTIAINGYDIDFSSVDARTVSINNLVHEYPLLSGISINAVLLPNTPEFIYSAKNLGHNKGAPQAKSHRVTFNAQNDIGSSKASFLVRVFSKPKFTAYPSNYNCTANCRNTEKQTFKCSIDEESYRSAGMTVKYLWYLNNKNLMSMDKSYIQMSYFQLNRDTVILNPIVSDNKGRDDKMANILRNSVLKCRVDIYHDPLQTSPQQQLKQQLQQPQVTSPQAKMIYSSDKYPELRPLLEAKIALQINDIARGSSSWIIPLIIALVILMIIILILIFVMRRSSTGESYNVDKKEKEQGRDPEKELRDLETFQPYERDLDNHLVQNSRLSFNDDDSVGVGSDDGELDAYDIDPGKFNEEGSFIGQYASDPRKTPKHTITSNAPLINSAKSNGTTPA